MDVVLVHPAAALLALGAAVPLAALAVSRRRARRVRRAVRLPAAGRRPVAVAAVAIAAAGALVGLAAAEPVVLRTHPQLARTDVEVYVVVDITRSMLASAGAGEPNRLERSRAIARRLRAALPDVPVGVASFTNRIVPHIFPTTDSAVFASGLLRSVDIERPPPDRQSGAVLTALDALKPLQTHNFYAPGTQRRVAVVLTDGETRPVGQDTVFALTEGPRLDLLFVRVWGEGERIHAPVLPVDRTYAADPAATEPLDEFARAIGAPVFSERAVDAAAAELRRRVGSGPEVVVGEEVTAHPLAAWAFALALVPLAYLLRRRNL